MKIAQQVAPKGGRFLYILVKMLYGFTKMAWNLPPTNEDAQQVVPGRGIF